jgi:hypothetical protein
MFTGFLDFLLAHTEITVSLITLSGVLFVTTYAVNNYLDKKKADMLYAAWEDLAVSVTNFDEEITKLSNFTSGALYWQGFDTRNLIIESIKSFSTGWTDLKSRFTLRRTFLPNSYDFLKNILEKIVDENIFESLLELTHNSADKSELEKLEKSIDLLSTKFFAFQKIVESETTAIIFRRS